MFAVRWAASLPDRRELTPDRVGTPLKINGASRAGEKQVKMTGKTGRNGPHLLQFDYYLPAEC